MDEAPCWENSTWRTWIEAILYEIQPMRPKDIKLMYASFKRSSKQIISTFCYLIKAVPRIKSEFRLLLNRSTAIFNVKFLLWICLASIFGYFEFGVVFLMLSTIYALFTIGVNHGGRREGELSAYSIFNEGFKTLIGTFDAEQFERELRRDPNWRLENVGLEMVGTEEQEQDEQVNEVNLNHQSRKRRAYQERLRRRNNNRHGIEGDDGWEEYDERLFMDEEE